MHGELHPLEADPVYFVNEIFASIQGEGLLAGTPAVFVRLQGCPVHCPWCDTKYTWKEGSGEVALVDPEEVFRKDSKPRCARITGDEVARQARDRWPRVPLAVVTGGEPCAQPVRQLLGSLERSGFRTEIETSGFLPVDVPDRTFVTVSPKITVPGGRVLPEALRRADEVKMVVGSPEDLAALDRILPLIPADTPVSLQPLSADSAASDLCFRTAMERGGRFRVSVQIHKYLGVR